MKFQLDGNTIEISSLGMLDFAGKLEEMSPYAFLESLRGYLRQKGVVVSLAGIWQIWTTFSKLSEPYAQHFTDIAYWYKIDPFELSEMKLFILAKGLSRAKAQETIYRGDYDPTNMDNVYKLFKLAFDDEDLAQSQKVEAAKKLIELRTANK